RADVTYANLEGPAAHGVNSGGKDVPDPGPVFDNYVYTSYPMFNYHPSIAQDLKTTGVDIVSTANNHAMDRGRLGADRTVEALDQAKLAYSGPHSTPQPARPIFTFTEYDAFRLAWIACSWGTNGLPDPANQVLNCFDDTPTIEAKVTELANQAG